MSVVGSAIVIGAIGGLICYGAMLFRLKKGLDESLDAWAVHGMGGLWGAIATGIFATAAIGGYSGLLEGNVDQFIANVIGDFICLGLRICGDTCPCLCHRQDYRAPCFGRGGVCRA